MERLYQVVLCVSSQFGVWSMYACVVDDAV